MKNHFQLIESKIQTWAEIKRTIAVWRVREDKIVFTNGCFDILHFGHLQYLAAARDLGDRLVVGLNSADSVRRLKGPTRPIHDEKTRTAQLAALAFVDAVVVFEKDDPLELVELVAPDFLVKGGDWQPEQIIGSDFVLKNGGKVLSLPFVEGYSTTLIERRILERGVV
jgi:D-glycero-beta-D-manno-heptose 1-phosphate adenylyltransferase